MCGARGLFFRFFFFPVDLFRKHPMCTLYRASYAVPPSREHLHSSRVLSTGLVVTYEIYKRRLENAPRRRHMYFTVRPLNDPRQNKFIDPTFVVGRRFRVEILWVYTPYSVSLVGIFISVIFSYGAPPLCATPPDPS